MISNVAYLADIIDDLHGLSLGILWNEELRKGQI